LNLGLSGETVEELQIRARGITARYQPPDLVVIMIGTNNVAMEQFSFLPAYQEIIDQFKKAWPRADIAINSLLPMNLLYLGQDAVADTNELLRQLAVNNNTLYIDAYRAMADANGAALPGILADEVHITEQGYEVWVKVLQEFFNA